jgi:serine/threonine protein kinase
MSQDASLVSPPVVAQPPASLPAVEAPVTAAPVPVVDRYRFVRRIGFERYAEISKAFDTVVGRYVAIKEVRPSGETRASVHDLQTEFAALIELQHPNVLKVLHSDIIDDEHARVVMEWMAANSMREILEETGFRLREVVVRRYAFEALKGLAYLHAQGMVHRNLKPSSLLISADGTVKIRAFGAGCSISASPATVRGTPAYMSPDVFTQEKFSVASDVWAFACCVTEMASGLPPWSEVTGTGPLKLVYRIGCAQPPNHHPTIPSHLSDELKALLMRCFAFDPAERPTAAELLATEYMLGAQTAASLPPSAESDAEYDARYAAKLAAASTSAEKSTC